MANGKATTRPRFEPGSYLSAADCMVEQNYLLQRMRRHNRYLHGWGVVCGLWVVPAGDSARPWAVQVCPGYAIGPYGDEIEVRERVVVDVRDFLWLEPAFLEARLRRAYIAIRYIEQLDRLLAIPQATCSCEDPVYGDSRVCDGHDVAALWRAPDPAPVFDLCRRQITPCPDCPESPWVVLARIILPASQADPILAAAIDNGVRRIV